MAFGKADTGLLKFTQQAEAGQDPGLGLMGAATLGSMISQMQKQEAAAAAARKTQSKDFWKLADDRPGNLSLADRKILNGQTQTYLNAYNSASEIDKANVMNEYNSLLDQWGKHQSLLDQNRASIGQSNRTQFSYIDEDYQTKLANNKYTTVYDEKSKSLLYRIPTYGSVEPIKTKAIEQIEKLQADNKALGDDEQQALDLYNLQVQTHENWKKSPEEDKYEFFNANDLPIAGMGDVEIQKKLLGLAGQNIYDKKTDNALKQSLNAGEISVQVKNSVFNTDLSYNQRQHIMFSDVDGDNIDGNTFGSLWTKGLDSEKHPDAYKKLDGSPIVVSFGDKSYEVSNDNDEWMELPEKQKEFALTQFLRGMGSDGRINRDANTDWLKERYSNFMGAVQEDALKTKQEQYFGDKGQYFEGPKGSKSHDNPIFNDKASTNNARHNAYVDVKMENALPVSLLDPEDENRRPQDIKEILDEDSIYAKTFIKEFGDYENLTFEIDKGVITVIDDRDPNTPLVHDFNADAPGRGITYNPRNTYDELIKNIKRQGYKSLDSRGQNELNAMPNKYKDWDNTDLHATQYPYPRRYGHYKYDDYTVSVSEDGSRTWSYKDQPVAIPSLLNKLNEDYERLNPEDLN